MAAEIEKEMLVKWSVPLVAIAVDTMAAAAGFTLPGSVSSVAGYFDVTNGAGIGSAANGQRRSILRR